MEKCLFYGNVMFLLLQYRYVVVMAFHTAMSASCELRPAIGRLTSSWGTRVYAVSTVSINTFFSLSLCGSVRLSICTSCTISHLLNQTADVMSRGNAAFIAQVKSVTLLLFYEIIIYTHHVWCYITRIKQYFTYHKSLPFCASLTIITNPSGSFVHGDP